MRKFKGVRQTNYADAKFTDQLCSLDETVAVLPMRLVRRIYQTNGAALACIITVNRGDAT